MTLYEAIYARRQVRKFNRAALPDQTVEDIMKFILETDQLAGQNAKFETVSAADVNGGIAPHYLLSYCDAGSAAYANVGYVLQKADLYIQSIGLGSGWFMSAQPKIKKENHCISLAFGSTDVPMRKGSGDFKRLPLKEICRADNAVAEAARLAPSAMNSQPWKLEFTDGKVVVKDFGRGVMRVMLRGKLNKIDTGIAARHAVLALEHEGKKVSAVIPIITGNEFAVEVFYS